VGTFWIPLLAAIFIARHVIIGGPVRYTVAEWSVVFPLGMYFAANCTYAGAAHFPILANVARITVPLAFETWILGSFRLPRPAPGSVRGQ
jgi:hypothetical protein